jgi:ADP-heptose:LPS heptosyltransferase/tetratricopeptide (TPR) repeat protein
MKKNLPRLLEQLWRAKAETSASGFVRFRPEAEETKRAVRAALADLREVLIVRLDAIGDNFLFLDSMRKLRALLPNADITIATYQENRPIYERCPFVNRGLFFDREAFASHQTYRDEQLKKLQSRPAPWDLLLNPLFSRERHSEEIVRSAPAAIKLGVAGDHSNITPKLAAQTAPNYSALLPVDAAVVRHELHRHNEICSLLGSEDETAALVAPLTDEDRAFAANLAQNFSLGRFGVVFPGGKGGTTSPKYWGTENYASLLDRLEEEEGWDLVLMCGPEDEQVESAITSATRAKPHVFRGDLSLWQAAALLERSAFYVGVDTSVAHISTALNVPTFVILGGGHFGRFFPYPAGHSATCLTHPLECFNCYWKCRLSYNKCVADISVDEVMTAFKAQPLPTPAASLRPAPPRRFPLPAIPRRLPRIDLVLPGGMQTWHLKEAWAMILEKAGCLHRVFRPTPATAGPLLDYLRTGGEADMILALGGDHHLGFLHDTEQKRESWQRYRGHRVCNSFESTRDSIYKHYAFRVKTALPAFTHFAYTDEVDAPIFAAAGRPALWWPQAADCRLFSSLVPAAERQPTVFFCGKVWNVYALRKALLQTLRTSPAFAFVEKASAGEMVSHYNRHLFAINLPGVLGGFNVRTYEALSCGSALLQFRPENRPANNALFEHGRHLLYIDYAQPEQLKQWIEERVRDPAAILPLARQGHEELLAHHTIERRLEQLVGWVFDQKEPAYPRYGEVSADLCREIHGRRFINDRYLFEDRPCWNPEALNEFNDLQFVNHQGFLRRICQEGELIAHRGRPVEAMRLFQAAVERDSNPDQAHNNLGVICWQRGERERAVVHFRAALKENPGYRPAAINCAEALTLAGRAGEARSVYADYLQREPSDAGVRTLQETGARVQTGAPN